ncbi:MAG: hypothetical protein EBU75_08360 [Betaproteobacteria bacterium]|jgi:hypothetical protein|nr:hypothetical protein [Betaproteobacteria bacterium]
MSTSHGSPQLVVDRSIMALTSGLAAVVMTLLFGVVLGWLSLRTLLLLAQVIRFSPENRLGEAFHQELLDRGLLPDPADVERLRR